MISLRKIWLLPLLCCLSAVLCAQDSVLHSGNWYKLSVDKPGVYRISFDLLRKMGIDPSKIDPRNIRIHGQGGGMLPQENFLPRAADLIENAIHVAGEADGVFHKTDYIIFYAEGPDKALYDATRDAFYHQKNLYSEVNYYFLTTGEYAGKRIAPVAEPEGDFPIINTFEDYAFHELDEFNIEHSGREWFGEKFGLTQSHAFTFSLPGTSAASTIKIVSDVLGQTYTDASFKIFLNGVFVGEQKILPIPNGRYSIKGLHKRDTLLVSSTEVNAAGRSSHEIKYEFSKGSGFSQGYLDFLLLQVTRDLSLYGQQTSFVSKASLSNPISTFEITNVPEDVNIWEITDPHNITARTWHFNSNVARFSAPTDNVNKFIVFNNTLPPPVFVSKVENQNLRGSNTPNLLIITHPDFRDHADRLAAHRQQHDNWSVQVVSTDKVYNEFSSGRQDVSALRDFAKHLHDKNPGALKAILLFGKASYDYKNRLINNTNFVPTYQSRNSLHPLQTYSSDDYFAFLEDHEGNWNESPAEHHTLDVGIGRLPVTTVDDAQNVVDKIIDYDTNQKTLGAWRKKIVFVADDGNTEDGFTSLHQYQADQLASIIEDNYPAFDTRKIFMGSYKKNIQPNGETVPGMEDDIKRSFDLGALIINFTGHGSEVVWTDERILTDKTISELTNDLYPFLVTATCEFGRQDNPQIISTAERAVLKKDAGAIGLVTTARPVNATTNFSLNEAFYESLFEKTQNGYATIGDVFSKTKNNSTSGVSNRNFSLIGDPSMVLALPQYTVDVTEIKTATGSDTLKALSTVTAKGVIIGLAGERLESFNGTVQATLFDKEVEFITEGRNNPAFAYKQWDNALFRGQATVRDGAFEFTFIMPKNLGYQIGSGKFSLYAFDPSTGLDAKGVHANSRVGGSEPDISGDDRAPDIQIFIGDTTFVNGGVALPDTDLIATFTDESGINISGYGIGNSIIAELDNNAETFVLNDYFITDKDTYTRGTVRFPMLGLAPGKHVITVKAWDVYNNPAQATIEFLVTEGQALVIESFGNYPNPFDQKTTLFFTHNRSGDELEAQLFIYSPAGELIRSSQVFIAESEYRINLPELSALEEPGKKLSPGLYLARLVVRSKTNGSKSEQVTKLIVLN